MLRISKEAKERIASGDMEALKIVLTKYKLELIETLDKNEGDLKKYQGASQTVTALLDIFNLNVCLSDD